ncbi:alpha/beta fold hydrolase [Yoonia sp. 208BN28-4]|uniref:alpha/beta fold hydrolase n=1 Tax=Yoonia sp. 208BN28-4 TaxID=3126505 RepID=UPI0030AC7755
MRLVLKTLTYGAAAIGLGAALTGCVSSKRVQDAETSYPPIGQFAEVTGGRVHYVQKGSGPHVVLLHGAGGNLRDYTFDLMDRLTDDYTVTAFDRPGLGYTDRVPSVETGALATDGDSPTAQAAMLREAATQIGITDPVVVGHSFGGIVAMAWATTGLENQADVNASGVVSLAGVMMPWPGDLGQYYTVNGSSFGGAVIIPLISAFAPKSAINSSIEGVFAPQPAPEGYAEYIGGELAIRPTTFRANVRQVNTLRPHVVAMAERYPNLTIPVEVVHGTADETVPITVHPEEAIKLIPDLNLIRLEGVGHMPHHADPQAAVDAINRAAARAGLR